MKFGEVSRKLSKQTNTLNDKVFVVVSIWKEAVLFSF